MVFCFVGLMLLIVLLLVDSLYVGVVCILYASYFDGLRVDVVAGL